MSVKQRSFWSTTSGVVTGVAGTLTGIVGLVTVAAQLGWIGGDGNESQPSNVQTQGSTAANAPRSGGGSSASGSQSGSGTGSATATPVFTVDPTRLTFDSITRKATVKVVNTGSVVMTVQSPTVSGANSTQFTATAPTCTREPVNPGRSCEVEVTFTPSRAGSYTATLAVQVTGARAQEVSLSGTSLL